ncbi:uncharacterized protein [Palaemon carinicauda]|uniref:uncharacterized protein n=1 Tax=Palaemon carinicauda TaxID=392227 RepID=UPI0035B67B1F
METPEGEKKILRIAKALDAASKDLTQLRQIKDRNEIWKSLGEEGIDILWDLTQKIFNQEKMPEEWRRSLLIPIYKGKGNIQAYDRVPRQDLWRCMREKGVPEKYVRITRDMYERTEANVMTNIGLTESFPVNVGLYQGSALSLCVFDLVMNVVTPGIRDQSPWYMLFANGVILCSTRREVVEEKLEE